MIERRLATTKLRLVREAVQHNVLSVRRRVRKPSGPRTPVLPILIASSALITSLIYLSVPSKAVPPVQIAAAAVPAASIEPSDTSSSPSSVPGAPPQRLARGVLPLAVKKIVLDAGHGGAQIGATSERGVREKEITLDIALRLRRLLANNAFEVLLTRETDATVSLERRVAFANVSRADLFVSIHVNWMPSRDIRPLETYYAGPTDDPRALSLARAENRDSGYSMSAYRRLLEKIYMDARRDESHVLARAVNTELYRSLTAINPWLENRGVKTAPFAVLLGTDMPAILVEVSCLSNEQEVELLTTADYREQVAAALLRGIEAYARDLDGVGKKEG